MRETSGPSQPPSNLPILNDRKSPYQPVDVMTRAAGAAVSLPPSDGRVPIQTPLHDEPIIITEVATQPRASAPDETKPAGEQIPVLPEPVEVFPIQTIPSTQNEPKPSNASTGDDPKDSPKEEPVGEKIDRRTLPKTDDQKAKIGAGVRRHYELHPHTPPRDEETHRQVSTRLVFADGSEEDITHLPAAAIHESVTRLTTEIEASGISADTRPHDYVTALAASVKGRINGEMQKEALSEVGSDDPTKDHAARTTLQTLNAKTILAAVNRVITNFDLPEEQRDDLTRRALTAVYTQAPRIIEQAQNDTKNKISIHIHHIITAEIAPTSPPAPGTVNRERPQPKTIEYATTETRTPANQREVRRLLGDVTFEITGNFNDYNGMFSAPDETVEAGLQHLIALYNAHVQTLSHTRLLTSSARKSINRIGRLLEGLMQGMDKPDLMNYVGIDKNYYGFTYQRLVDFLTADDQA